MVGAALRRGGERAGDEQARHRECGEGYVLTAEHMRWFLGQYIPEGINLRHPDLSPLYAESLAGMPPALILTAEYDPLRDEGEAYAERLREAGVAVSVERVVHSFFSMTGRLPAADRAVSMVAEAVKIALA